MRHHIRKTPLAAAITLALAGWQPLAFAQEQTEEQTDQDSGGVIVDGLQAPSNPIEEIVAIGRALSTAEQLVSERMDDSVVVDLLGADAISRLGDSTVAAALRRVPGLTLVNDKFVYIRGLGERYSASMLNGAQIPSPDLTRNVIPLDIFPAVLVESLRVQKAYSPDLPANFGGGNVEIRTKSVPDGFAFQFEIGGGFNTETSGDVFTYTGGTDDSFGTDDGSRSLNPQIIDTVRQFQGDVGVTNIASTLRAGDPSLTLNQSITQAEDINRGLGLLLNRDLQLQTTSPDPDFDVKAAIGNSFFLGEEWEVGFLVGGTYSNNWRERTSIRRDFTFPDIRRDTEVESTRNVNISGNLNFGVKFLEDHEIETTTLYLRNTDDETAVRDFFNENREIPDGFGFRDIRYEFEERNMVVNQVRGTHVLGFDTREKLGGLGNLISFLPEETEISWFFSDSAARTDIPNRVVISANTVTDPVTGAVQSSAVALDNRAADYGFLDLDDDVESYAWKATIPISTDTNTIALSFGYQNDRKSRTFQQSLFSLGPNSPTDTGFLSSPLEQVFSTSSVSNPDNDFIFDLQGTDNQSYIAATITDAFFGNVDWTWNDTWRVAVGARFEDYRQVAVDWNPFGFSETNPQITTDPDVLEAGSFQDDDLYPAVAVTYMTSWWAETFQLRFGYSETAVRPDLREITDASYIDPVTGDLVDGDPSVRPASVSNFDVRGEWFFDNGDNLTVTAFYKDIEDPIEFFATAVSDTGRGREIVNAESAEVLGVEVEALKDLSFLGEAFSPFFIQGNITVQDSEIVAGPNADAPTNPTRKLAGASDFVVNLQLGFDSNDAKHSASLAYNVFDERLYLAGRNGDPDEFEQPFNSMDIIYTWYPTDNIQVKGKLQNILGEEITIERNGVVTFEEDPGSTFAISFQYQFL
ncbi:MAG: TonB-dependent receptor [Pseudomonadota bacterium]